MSSDLTPAEQRILDMILRADRAGSALTLPQLRERLGSARLGGGIHATITKFETLGLIWKERGADLRGAITLRRPKAVAR